MKCPVCDREAGTARACPSCGADLGAIQAIRELPARLASEGVQLAREGRLLAGVERLQAAAVLAPEDGEIRRALVEVLVEAGLDEMAWVHLRPLLAANGQDAAARKAAERLRRRVRVRAAVDRIVRAFADYLP